MVRLNWSFELASSSLELPTSKSAKSFFNEFGCRHGYDVSDGQTSRSPTVNLRYKVWKNLERESTLKADALYDEIKTCDKERW